MVINGYLLEDELCNENSGFSKWGFCQKDGRRYFIKEFLSPTYPFDKSKMTDKQIERKTKECKKFEDRLLKMYEIINRVSDGNVVRIQEFFRCNSKYYIVTDSVNFSKLSIRQISELPYYSKRFLCKVITHSLLQLHNEGFVHADIKHNNILVVVNEKYEKCTAKIIDFDCGFFGTEPPQPGEELNGDPVYFAPEMLLHMMEEDVALSCKIDVFALGVLFHQYFTGEIPYFDKDKYDYLSEAILDDAPVIIHGSINDEMAEIIEKMLVKDPAERISLQEVYDILSYHAAEADIEPEIEEPVVMDETDTMDLGSNLKIYKGNRK